MSSLIAIILHFIDTINNFVIIFNN